MNQAMQEIASRAVVQEMRLEVLANNLANISTTGFKQDRTVFRVPVQKDGPEEAFVPGKIWIFGSPILFGNKTDFSSGQLRHTGNDLDLGLEGNGFFCVQTPEGIQYTRQGDFTLNGEGVLVTQEGLPVMGEGGKITVEGQSVVDIEGNLYVDGTEIDRIKIVDFPRPYALRKVGNTLFAAADPSIKATAAEGIKVRQGFVELSNVDSVKMIIEMIDVVRGYESYQKVIQFMDDASSKAINEVGKLK